jgi:hypothetical protein
MDRLQFHRWRLRATRRHCRVEIPAFAIGGVIEMKIPVLARRRVAVRFGDAVCRRRGAGRECERHSDHAGQDHGNAENNTHRHGLHTCAEPGSTHDQRNEARFDRDGAARAIIEGSHGVRADMGPQLAANPAMHSLSPPHLRGPHRLASATPLGHMDVRRRRGRRRRFAKRKSFGRSRSENANIIILLVWVHRPRHNPLCRNLCQLRPSPRALRRASERRDRLRSS